MPWKECNIVEERLRFIARLLDGEKMAGLCREFGIARKTGYKIYHRYKDCGIDGLPDRSRRPYRHANQLPMQIEKLIVNLKKEYPHWGAIKIRERLRTRYRDLQCPAVSTVHAVLDRHGLVKRKKRRRNQAQGTALGHVTDPNELWCADYKGEFMLTNRQYCYPLTITDYASRYLITVDAFYGLSKLSVWWLRFGIDIERIKPGHPEQNGRHERMHLTLKNEATRPASDNFLQQQARFDSFIDDYNQERPHQALQLKVPADLYTKSPRPYEGLGELEDPVHDFTATVTRCGRICYKRRKINLSTVFAGQKVGVKQVSDKIWLVSFMHYDLGYFDHETCRLEPIENPFAAKVLPMSPE